ncbi:uncharacterized protein LOC102929557 isoform X5 [Chelonia mydas]|uniref:uncharacterized protein LOC102929557 isoform X5 n=1 Tax=Chelonia mydas TaxID=8469 RepID=UPI001CA9BB46|nr:uncharacterized protein LOC102929557 isoform X5 [Chelonia mydas]
MPRLEEVANVALRVPSVVLLDLLYRWDVQAFAELLRPQQEEAPWRRRALWHAYYLGHMLCVGVLLLPVRSLVRLYLYGLTLLLLFVGHQTARDYLRHEMEYEFQGAVYQDPVVLSRFMTALTGQIFVSTLCALLMKTKQVWLFCAPLLPLLARLCGLPLQALPMVNAFATSVTVVEVLYVAASHLLAPFHLAAAVCREMAQGLEMYRLVALAMSLWSQRAIPLLFLVFWLVLFTLQIYSFLASSNSLLAQQGLLFIFLSSVAECCGTPYSLLGLTFTVSYLALAVLNLCKFYLLGYDAFQNGNVMHRSWLCTRSGGDRMPPAGARLLVEAPCPLLLLAWQRCDGGRDPAAAGSPDGAAGPADPAENLPPQHHPLHRGDVDPAVHDRDSRPHRAGAGGFAEQEPLEALPQPQLVPLPAGFPLLHGVQDRSLLPHGLLAADPGLQLHAHLPAGDGHPLRLRALHDRAVPGCAPGEDGRDHLLCQCGEPGAGVPGGRLRGGLWHLGVHLWRVELDGRLCHHHPLLLQRVAAGPVGLEELPAPQGGRQEDQLAAQGHQGTAEGPQRRVCHLLPVIAATLPAAGLTPPHTGCDPEGDGHGRDHRLRPLLPHGLPPQVAVRAGHLPHVPPAGEALGHRGPAASRGRAGGAGAHPRGAGA